LPFSLGLPSLLSVPSGGIPLYCLRLSGLEMGHRQFYWYFQSRTSLKCHQSPSKIECWRWHFFITDVPTFTPEPPHLMFMKLESHLEIKSTQQIMDLGPFNVSCRISKRRTVARQA
jgi:hypothetical protein